VWHHVRAPRVPPRPPLSSVSFVLLVFRSLSRSAVARGRRSGCLRRSRGLPLADSTAPLSDDPRSQSSTTRPFDPTTPLETARSDADVSNTHRRLLTIARAAHTPLSLSRFPIVHPVRARSRGLASPHRPSGRTAQRPESPCPLPRAFSATPIPSSVVSHPQRAQDSL
jgi:hypothetical protein